jgi:uncharacterized membrane protein (GlpM family)
MQFSIKLVVTVLLIILCSQIGRRWPTLSGLIATAPITTLIVLLWLYTDKPGDYETLKNYVRGVLWGVIPTVLFYVVAYICLSKRLSFGAAIAAGFGVWLIGATVHQWLLK